MEVLEKGKTLSINADQRLPIKEIFVDAGIVLILIWGVFACLVFFHSQQGREILPYFIAITLLLVVPLVSGILIRKSRHYREILFDGERGLLSVRGVWRRRQFSFDEINELQVKKYRFKKKLFLYRFDVALSSGKTLRLIQDIQDKEALCLLGRKVRRLVGKPLNINP